MSRPHRPAAFASCATAAVLLSTGCSLVPPYQRGPLPVADAYPVGPAYARANAGPAGGVAAADIGWRDFFAAPRLQQLLEIALSNNRDLRTAVLNVELLRAQYRFEAAPLYPQISALAESSRSRIPADTARVGSTGAGQPKIQSLGATLAWEIDLFGRLRSNKAAAFERYVASIEGRRAAQILLVSQVANQYLLLLASDELLAVTRRTLQTASASYDLVNLQFETGVASELDLRQAQTIVEQSRANQAAQLRARAQAENGLVLLLGQPQPLITDAAGRLDELRILADIPAGLPSDLLMRRPDIREVEALLRASNADVGAARAAFFPSIELTGNGGTASAKLGGLFAAGSTAWSWTASVAESLFDAGANRANLRAARVARDISIAQYEKAVQSAFREVADSLAARGTYDDEIVALERFTAAQQRRLELAQLIYANGSASYLDVLSAQTDLYDAELNLVIARLNRLTTQVDLYRALGGGWTERTNDHPSASAAPGVVSP